MGQISALVPAEEALRFILGGKWLRPELFAFNQLAEMLALGLGGV